MCGCSELKKRPLRTHFHPLPDKTIHRVEYREVNYAQRPKACKYCWPVPSETPR